MRTEAKQKSCTQKLNTLYHYCSTSTFRSIIETRSIYLSLLSLSNDITEGKIVTNMIKDVGTEKNKPTALIDLLVRLFELFEIQFQSIGFCLSGADDLLSQWNEYGSKGNGVAIGFSENYLQKISTNILNLQPDNLFFTEVFYEHNVKSEILPIIENLYSLLDSEIMEKFNSPSIMKENNIKNSDIFEFFKSKQEKQFFTDSLNLVLKIHSTKSSDYSAEKEWRLFDYLYLPTLNSKILYRERNDLLIPYRIFNLPYLENGIFEEIVLGPNHPTPARTIEDFLRNNGFTNVKVRKSKIPYRSRT